MYHSVSPSGPRARNGAVAPALFGAQMVWLRGNGYTAVTLDDLRAFAVGGLVLPQRPVVITFDDGYADFTEHALPVLRDHGFTATVFAVGSLVGGTSVWMREEQGVERPLMGWREIEGLRREGITIGSHGSTHRRLGGLDRNDALDEIAGSKLILEERLGAAVEHFAYPYGDMSESVAAVVREAGYLTACSTRSGFNGKGMDLFALRRLDVYGTDTVRRFAVKVTYGTNDGTWSVPLRYYGKRLFEKMGVQS